MTGKRQLKKWIKALVELLFPPRCYCCGARAISISEGLCCECLAGVLYIVAPICRICGGNFITSQPENHICECCLRHRPPYSMARGIIYYEEPVRSLLHNLKYSYDTAAADPLLKIARSFDFSAFDSCEIFLPVPLHRQRLKRRGFNQALFLAKLLFPGRNDCIFPQILRKRHHTRSQTELDAIGRKQNLRSAFSVEHSEIIINKKICLVDDVYTTGTTVSECAATLMRAGASEVRVLTFARVREFR
ncbi:ComF family protein [Desulfopila inferna]|uniref:ComF family protein n=1 Tax=Desulfopila inferna TaxID=468528 RepID=UPI001965C3C5|nr:ComF family protein [Desulfopila inferna]MBM9605041.1 ComF family protein [Desulfopila inferna]